MTHAKLRLMLLAIHRGEITRACDAERALGISIPTLWRWVEEARAQGVRIDTIGPGRREIGEPWRVIAWGPYRREKPKQAA